MELDNLESAFDLKELLDGGNEGTSSISKGVFAFKGVAVKRNGIDDACDTPSKSKKGNKKINKSPRKKFKQSDSVGQEHRELEKFKHFSAASGNFKGDIKIKTRFENYLKILKEALCVMQSLQGENYSQIIDQVVKFVQKAKSTPQEKDVYKTTSNTNDCVTPVNEESVSLFRDLLRSSEIPTAALLTGVNVPDHSDFFKLLSVELQKQKVSPHVATIQAKECGTSLRQLMKVIVRQLINTNKVKNEIKNEIMEDKDTDDEDDEDENIAGNGCKAISNKRCSSLMSLKLWYDNQYPSFSDRYPEYQVDKKHPRYGSAQKYQRPPLIIILEDFEAFVPKILQELVRNLSLLSDKAYGFNGKNTGLQFVLVFGIATTVDTIHRTLPHSVTSQLAIEKFAAQPSIRLIATIVEKILVKNPAIPFQVGGKTLEILLETFLFHDFSVKHFIMAYKCCMLEHFSQNTASILCCETENQIRTAIENMSMTELNVFRNLPSLKELMEKNVSINEKQNKSPHGKKGETFTDSKELQKLIETNTSFKQYILRNIMETKKAIETFNIFVDALHALTCDLPRQPLGKYYHTVYNKAMTESIHRSQKYREAFQFLQLSEKSGMLKQLNAFLACLKPYLHNEEAKTSYSAAVKYVDELENFDKIASPSKDENSVEEQKPNIASPISNRTPKEKIDRFKWKEALLEQAKEKEKKRQDRNPFEVIRRRILDFYNSTFTRILSLDDHCDSPTFHPLKQVFHEVFYFNDANAVHNKNSHNSFVKERIHGAPRFALQNALQLPNFYLKPSDQAETDRENEDPRSLPDLCIAYKLYLENSRYINLFDWLRCWITIVTNGDEEHAPDSKNKLNVDPKLQARFSRCVSELQYLGYIRPSKRKTDHVEKLTWD